MIVQIITDSDFKLDTNEVELIREEYLRFAEHFKKIVLAFRMDSIQKKHFLTTFVEGPGLRKWDYEVDGKSIEAVVGESLERIKLTHAQRKTQSPIIKTRIEATDRILLSIKKSLQPNTAHVNPIKLNIDPRKASVKDLVELFAELSKLYQMVGGSGLSFNMGETMEKVSEVVCE